ncbi:MAG: STAS domain-containing protein [Chromatiales bacterium]|jgi:anti-anti-sigma regulatory factor
MTVKKKTPVRKKAAVRKKTVSKKTAVKKKVAAKKQVMDHDPLSMLDQDQPAEQEPVEPVLSDPVAEAPPPAAEPVVAAADEVVVETSTNEEKQMDEQQPQPVEAGASYDLGGNLTIADVELKKAGFLQLIDDARAVALNGSDIDSVDGAGLQLLAAFIKDAGEKNIAVSWDSVSPALHDAVKMSGLIAHFGMTDVEVEDDGEGTSWGLF